MPSKQRSSKGVILLEIVVTVAIIMGSLVFILQGYSRMLRVLDSCELSMQFGTLSSEAIYLIQQDFDKENPEQISGIFPNNPKFSYQGDVELLAEPNLWKLDLTLQYRRHSEDAKPYSYQTTTYFQAS